MDIGPLNRPTQQPAPVVARPDPQPVREAVTTELSPAKTVTATAPTEAASVEISRAARALQDSSTEEVRKQTTKDQDTNALVFRKTDTRTGEVVQQIPDEAILRLRAYIAAAQAKTKPDTPADVEHVAKSA
ncbi:flagellar protein FlaG [uncultured Alsobacter sp.]|uniref:flagellar protein FlaG n=1 Tax=uncultured Alsobacter sp. TaxID=1748258 RepID=UPI002601430A|nr:flagellar protein FlaG [uncultured Alsobacter sp.]